MSDKSVRAAGDPTHSAAVAGTGPVPSAPRVYILLVNYGPGWDTLECLESVLRLDYPNYQVVLCDNGPPPGFSGLLRAWAAGRLELLLSASESGRPACFPAVPKPVSIVCHGAADLEAGRISVASPGSLVLITSGSNRGFAGGSNLAMRYAELCGDADYFWLLNNDTVVASDALSALVRCAESDVCIGLCGSTLIDYARPERIQARGGGRYDPWVGRTELAGRGKLLSEPWDEEPSLDFIHGASALVRRRFVEEVGRLDERYFLYFEELDWARRARGRFRLAHAGASRVWHKDGGAASAPEKRSIEADYHGIRSRLLFTRRYHPAALPTVYLGLLFALVNRARRGQWARIGMILRLMLRPG